MFSVDAQEIRDWLARYVAREISLQDFEDWFVPATWDVHRGNDSVAVALVGEIKLRLAEFSGGGWKEEELRELLQPLAPPYIRRPSSPWVAGSSSRTDIRPQDIREGPVVRWWEGAGTLAGAARG